MTNQEKIEYLKRYGVCLKEVERLQDEKERLKSIRDKVTPTYSDMPKGGGSDKTDISAAIIDLDLEIDDQIVKWIALGEEVRQAIEGVDDYNLRLLLKYRYISMMTFEQVAVTMNYSWRWVHKLHAQALSKVDILVHTDSVL
ncbi:DUF1492 domain-containing protein [Aminipila butyrica]|uniref:DUF1492 domain-containing protein n=1 Tax=Aminipila butyrica TaxID=433296 RepID=A0A858BU04_9FIRM|nr:DUF1492 domain-containing protein [Aminipila butyrica]QIB68254.1 DUF1492 domain-containing protein [Aminipila butyrica]